MSITHHHLFPLCLAPALPLYLAPFPFPLLTSLSSPLPHSFPPSPSLYLAMPLPLPPLLHINPSFLPSSPLPSLSTISPLLSHPFSLPYLPFFPSPFLSPSFPRFPLLHPAFSPRSPLLCAATNLLTAYLLAGELVQVPIWPPCSGCVQMPRLSREARQPSPAAVGGGAAFLPFI